MRRGAILHYVVGSQQLRVVVITADRYNPDQGLVAPLRQRTPPDRLPAFLVPVSRQDWPTAGFIDLSKARSLDAGSVTGNAGQLTRSTLDTLSTAVRTYFGA
jgi:mRNA-degrading endonuclease toxin of MazEF toxin-antitoxin module